MMSMKDVFFLCKETISPGVRYIKELDTDKYMVHEYRKNSTLVYLVKVKSDGIQIIEEKEVS